MPIFEGWKGSNIINHLIFTVMKAFLKIQCKSKSGKIGDFLTDTKGDEITPVFHSMYELATYIGSKYNYELLKDRLTYELSEK